MQKLKEREALTNISSYKPAKNLERVKEEYGIDNIIKLAGNENRLGYSEQVIKALLENQRKLSFYPDANCSVLREKLSKIHKVNGENLVFGNGSFELISLIALAYLEEKDESIIPNPTFGWYTNVTLQMGAKIVNTPLKDLGIDLKSVKEAITNQTKIIWICNPNNPTGTVLNSYDLLEFIAEIPENILIVLDEAYVDFIEEEYIDTIELIKKYNNVILLRTFSKLYGLASLRIGYGIASTDIIEKLNKIRNPINVNFIAQKAAEVSLEDKEFKNRVLENNRKSLQLYYSELDAVGIKYIRSNGNFILINTGLSGKKVEQDFLKHGIMIRNAEEFGLKGFIRISLGTWEENKLVISTLKKILSK